MIIKKLLIFFQIIKSLYHPFNNMNSKNKYINVMISYLFAISMATSFFTSLRIKYVGISELCFLVLIIILFFKYHKYIFLFNKKI